MILLVCPWWHPRGRLARNITVHMGASGEHPRGHLSKIAPLHAAPW